MEETKCKFRATEMTKMFDQFNAFFYVCGMKNFWVSELKLYKRFVKILDKLLILSDVMIMLMMISNFAALYTQKNLLPRQSSDLILFCWTVPVMLYEFYTLKYYRPVVRDILYHLVVVLKEHYTEKEAVLQLAKKTKLYIGLLAFTSCAALVQRVISSVVRAKVYGEVFNPFTTAWPDVNDNSLVGLGVRILHFVATCCYSFRTNGVHGMILILLLTLSYQFKDLQSYFYSLENIFEDNILSQEEKEKQYEEGFKRGIYLHALSLWCVRRCQYVCRTIFSAELFLTMGAMIFIMKPLILTEGISAKLPHVPVLLALLTILGIVMWNSGNITHEAECVSNAMYASGWHNCHGRTSVRVRKLVVTAMLQAQGCGFSTADNRPWDTAYAGWPNSVNISKVRVATTMRTRIVQKRTYNLF